MKPKFCSLLAGASLFVLASAANAAQPVALSDSQMDRVTAGASALAAATAFGLADFAMTGQTETATEANFPGRVAFAFAESENLAISVAFQAFSATHAHSAASLP